MKMPWEDKTGLAQAAVVLSVVLLVSLGLCGANFGLMFVFKGGESENGFLIMTAFLEAVGIIVGVGGLMVVGVVSLLSAIVRWMQGNR